MTGPRNGASDGRPARKGRFAIVVLVSGNGSNLQAIIDTLHRKVARIEVALVVSNVPGVFALERARQAGIPTAVFPLEAFPNREERDLAIAAAVEAVQADLVVLAGYMHVLTPSFVARFPHRIVNLHPALLPSFPGTHAIEDALRYGVKVTGVTVHFVDEGVDSGPVIQQQAVGVMDGDTVDTLATRIHRVEHMLLPKVIELIAQGQVIPPEPGSRWVRIIGSSEVSRLRKVEQ